MTVAPARASRPALEGAGLSHVTRMSSCAAIFRPPLLPGATYLAWGVRAVTRPRGYVTEGRPRGAHLGGGVPWAGRNWSLPPAPPSQRRHRRSALSGYLTACWSPAERPGPLPALQLVTGAPESCCHLCKAAARASPVRTAGRRSALFCASPQVAAGRRRQQGLPGGKRAKERKQPKLFRHFRPGNRFVQSYLKVKPKPDFLYGKDSI